MYRIGTIVNAILLMGNLLRLDLKHSQHTSPTHTHITRMDVLAWPKSSFHNV